MTAPIDSGRTTGLARHAECVLCLHRSTRHFYSALSIPVTCASVFDDREQALAVPRGDLHLVACERCGLAFNTAFDDRLGQIGARYESSQAASSHFNQFASELARRWADAHQLAGRTVLEVGSGNGDFLKHLLDAGAQRVIGIDPIAKNPNDDERLITIQDVFNARYQAFDADALVCRHTLEHIRDVTGFLSNVHGWARDTSRVVLFEVPDGERVFKERAFWDVYYEHCNYFTETTLRFAFERSGFKVLRLERVYGGQYLLLEAVASFERSHTHPIDDDALSLYDDFGEDVRRSIARCDDRLRQLTADGTSLALWQAASKTVGFLGAIQSHDRIAAAVDVSADRQGKFLPGTGMRIHAPNELTKLAPHHIVLMNPVYLEEVRAHIQSLGLSSTRVHSVNELLL